MALTKAKGKLDPTGDKDATKVAMCNDENIACVDPMLLVLFMVLPNLSGWGVGKLGFNRGERALNLGNHSIYSALHVLD